MKTASAIVIAGLAATVAAQLPDLPMCALTCLTSNIGATGCGLTEFDCSCSNEPFVLASKDCIDDKCDPADVEGKFPPFHDSG